MSNKTYDILKWVITTLLPALSSLYLGIGQAWNLPYHVEIPTTIMAIVTFLSTMLQKASKEYLLDKEIIKKEDKIC